MSNIIKVTSDGMLRYHGLNIRCALGKEGVTDSKREGDLKTPLGTFPLREVFFRADRKPAPHGELHVTAIEPNMGWCDDPQHVQYNKPVLLPFEASHEMLYRDDQRYDYIVPLGYNDDPAVPGQGSAIFFHLASPDYVGTEGCVAVSFVDMWELLGRVNEHTVMEIKKL